MMNLRRPLRVSAIFLAAAIAMQSSAIAQEAMEHKPAPASTSLAITGLDGKTLTLTPADLKGMPHKTISVYNEHAKVNETYSGVVLADLLAKAGAPQGEKVRGKLFLIYLVAAGTDGYRVLYSLAETDPANHVGDVIVADTLNGQPITTDGAFKLVSTEEKRPARWVRSLTSITLKSAE